MKEASEKNTSSYKNGMQQSGKSVFSQGELFCQLSAWNAI